MPVRTIQSYLHLFFPPTVASKEKMQITYQHPVTSPGKQLCPVRLESQRVDDLMSARLRGVMWTEECKHFRWDLKEEEQKGEIICPKHRIINTIWMWLVVVVVVVVKVTTVVQWGRPGWRANMSGDGNGAAERPRHQKGWSNEKASVFSLSIIF